MLESLVSLYRQLGGLGTVITLSIVLIFIGAVYANILIRRKYITLSQELAGFCAGEYHAFDSDILQWMTEEYKEAAQSGLTAINTSAIIDTGFQAFLKLCSIGERFLKKANALLITTGLFGTFVGLTYAVGKIGTIMTNTTAETLMSTSGSDTLALLVSSFQGMAVAFLTSLFGTGFSIFLMFITTLYSATGAKNLLISQIEEFLDIKVSAEINAKLHKAKENEGDISKKSIDTLIASITIFDRCVSDFSSNFKGLKSFNDDLVINIEQIKTSTDQLCNALDKTSSESTECGLLLYKCMDSLQNLVDEMTHSNKHLENSASVLSGLQSSLEASRKDRELFLKAVSEIPDKLLNYHEAAVASADRKQVRP